MRFRLNIICVLDIFPLMKLVIFVRNIRRCCCIVYGCVTMLSFFRNLIQVLLPCSRNGLALFGTCLRQWCWRVLSFGLLCFAPQLGVHGSGVISSGRSSPNGVFTSWVVELRLMLWNFSTRIINPHRFLHGVLRCLGLRRRNWCINETLMPLSLTRLVVRVLERCSVISRAKWSQLWVKKFLWFNRWSW